MHMGSESPPAALQEHTSMPKNPRPARVLSIGADVGKHGVP